MHIAARANEQSVITTKGPIIPMECEKRRIGMNQVAGLQRAPSTDMPGCHVGTYCSLELDNDRSLDIEPERGSSACGRPYLPARLGHRCLLTPCCMPASIAPVIRAGSAHQLHAQPTAGRHRAQVKECIAPAGSPERPAGPGAHTCSPQGCSAARSPPRCCVQPGLAMHRAHGKRAEA